jgi:hypothetical protein
MIAPKPPTGDSPRAVWFRWAHEQILQLRQMDVQGRQMGRTTRGTYILPAKAKKK